MHDSEPGKAALDPQIGKLRWVSDTCTHACGEGRRSPTACCLPVVVGRPPPCIHSTLVHRRFRFRFVDTLKLKRTSQFKVSSLLDTTVDAYAYAYADVEADGEADGEADDGRRGQELVRIDGAPVFTSRSPVAATCVPGIAACPGRCHGLCRERTAGGSAVVRRVLADIQAGRQWGDVVL